MRRINQMRLFVRNERGVVLPLVLMAFVVLGALSSVLLSIGSSETQITSNHLRSVQADFLAEAGLEHAYNYLQADTSRITSPITLYNSQLGGAGSAIGGYWAQYQAAGANTVRVISTGISAVGGLQKIRRATMSTSFISPDAIRTRGPLSITGNGGTEDPVFQGQCGSVHTNDDLVITGSPSISGAATASDDYTVTGNPSVGPGSGGDQPQKTIPVINPTNFLNAAQASLPANQVFQMNTNGEVRDGAGTLLTTLASGDEHNGWRYTAGSPAQWNLSGNTGYNGTYYFEGNASVSGNPGSSSTPWVTTLIATGDVIIAGNPAIQPSLTDTLFVAGLDIVIGGNPNGYNGMIAAHEQFRLHGNPIIHGFLIAEDASAIGNTVTSNQVDGNPTIIYSCDRTPPLQGPLQILSWGL